MPHSPQSISWGSRLAFNEKPTKPKTKPNDASGHLSPQVIRLKTLLDERDADLESLRAERKDLITKLSAQASGQVCFYMTPCIAYMLNYIIHHPLQSPNDTRRRTDAGGGGEGAI